MKTMHNNRNVALFDIDDQEMKLNVVEHEIVDCVSGKNNIS